MSKFPEVSSFSGTEEQGIIPPFAGWFTGTSRIRTITNTEQFSFNGYRYDSADAFWILPEAAVNGTVTHSVVDKGRTLVIGGGATDKIVSQTRQRFVYASGNAHVLTFAALSTLQEGRVVRYGYFDENDGAFFEFKKLATGYDVYVVRRRGGVDTRVAQADWNIDSLDGISRSGETLNLDNIQMLMIDFTWYGAGEILLGFKMNRRMVPIHCFVAGNEENAPIINNPNLPVRFELFNDGGPTGVADSWIRTYGIHLGIDGSDPAQRVGFPRTFRNTFSVSSGLNVLTSIRPKLTYKGQPNASWWQISDIQIRGSVNGDLIVMYNPVLTNPVWTDVDTNNSFTEYDISATAHTGGVEFYSILFSTSKGGDKVSFPVFKDALSPSSDGTETYHITFLYNADSNGQLTLAVNWNEKY